MSFVDQATLRLAFRNLIRQRSKTIASLAAIGLGVACLILAGGFVKDILFQLGEATIHSQTGHFQIAHENYWKTRGRSGTTIDSPDKIRSIIGRLPDIEQIVARRNFIGMLNNGKRDLGIFGDGIEPDGEAKIGSFMRYIAGAPLGNSDAQSIVVGQGVSQALNLNIGDYVTLVTSLSQGAINTAEFKVTGIFQSFSKEFDARAVRIPLPEANELLAADNPHLLVATLKNTRDTDQVAAIVAKELAGTSLEIRTWRELSDFYEKTVKLYQAQFGVLQFIIFLMVLLSVANSINMTLYERTREFGTALAIGSKPKDIWHLILIESIVLGLAGALLGMVLGNFLAIAISAIGISMPPPPNSNVGYLASIQLDAEIILSSALVGALATILAALLPGRRASRINIIDALRHGV